MKKILNSNRHIIYSLHDMDVTAFETDENVIIMRTSGMKKITSPYIQPDGFIEFRGVDWEFSYAYILDFDAKSDKFTGRKMYLKDFISEFPEPYFTVMDETYAPNLTKYSGYIVTDKTFRECFVEIHYSEEMYFVDETEYSGMREVILSNDDYAKICSVPAEVAAYLDEYCWEFAANWVWQGPQNAKFIKNARNGQLGAVFGVNDFLNYLNEFAFPEYHSYFVKNLECYDYEIPTEYKDYPSYNF